jgi:hypothetical protein
MTVEMTDEVMAICKLLRLDPNLVARLDIRPRTVTVELYKLRKGRKFFENSQPATETRKFDVKI